MIRVTALLLAVAALPALSVVYDVNIRPGPRADAVVLALAARAQQLCPADDIQFSWAVPHVTLYQTDFIDGSIPDVINAVHAVVEKSVPCAVTLTQARLSGAYFMLDVELGACLRKLCDAIVEATYQWQNTSQPVPDWVYTSPNKDALLAMFKKYGSPNVFQNFEPHITVAWDDKDNMTALMSEPYEKVGDMAVTISVGLVGPHGTVLRGKDAAVFNISLSSSDAFSSDEVDNRITILAGIITGACSTVGSAIIVLSYALFPELRSSPRLMIMLLSVADFGQALFFCVPFDGWNDVFCDLKALWGIYFADASFLWTAAIAAYVYVSVRNLFLCFESGTPNRILKIDNYFLWFNLFAWGIPLLIVVLVASFQVEGETSVWCFIPEKYIIWRIIAIYVPLFFSIIITTVFNVLAIIWLQRIKKRYGTRKGVRDLAGWQIKLLLIPIIFIVLRVPGVIYRIAELFGGHFYEQLSRATAFTVVMAVGDSAQGFINFFIFVVAVRTVREHFTSLLLHCRRTEHPVFPLRMDADSGSQPLIGTISHPMA